MGVARQVVELGRRVRVETKVRTRQPLAEAIAHVPDRTPDLEALLPIVADELNVHRVRFATSEDPFGTWRAKPDFKVLGPRLGSRVKSLADTLAGDVDGDLAGRLAAGETVSVAIDDGPAVEITAADVELARETLAGWGVASEGGVTVALELALTPDLEREGFARELVRIVQDARKSADLDVSDRIALGLDGDQEVVAVRDRWASFIAGETLATELGASVTDPAFETDADVDGRSVRVQLRPLG